MRRFRELAACSLALSILLLPAPGHATTKSWYLNLGLGGVSGPSYASNAKFQAVQAAAAPSATNIAAAADLGVYWTVGPQTILGLADHGVSDDFTPSGGSASSATYIINSNLCVSAMHFLGKEPGNGLGFRADVGLSSLGTASGFNFIPSNPDYGAGAMGAIVLGIPFSEKFKTLLQGGYSYAAISSGAIHSIVITGSAFF